MQACTIVNSLSVLAVVTLCGSDVLAQSAPTGPGPAYPIKPVRILTSLPGGTNDMLARLFAQEFPATLGQPVVVDNRPAVISIETLAKAPPDGYTLLVQGASIWITPLMREQIPYDPIRDFQPITQIIREVGVLVVHPGVAAKSIKELIALAKARPGQLNYGSGASGTSNHLAMELLKSLAGINIVRVPYKSGGMALIGLLANEVQMTVDSAGSMMAHLKSGKLNALAVSSTTPSLLMPELPTIAASGVPGYDSVAITGFFAPGKTPMAIVERLNREALRVLIKADVKDSLFRSGVEVVTSSPKEFAAAIQSDITKWSKVIKDAGIKAD